MIDSLESEYMDISKESHGETHGDADHWCAENQMWHTKDHQQAEPPQVNVTVEKAYDQNTNLPPEFGKREEGESVASMPFLRRRDDEEGVEKEVTEPFAVATSQAKKMGHDDFSEGSAGEEKRDEIAEAIKEGLSKSYEQSLDILKIWASLDKALPKDDESILLNDLEILKSFDLDVTTNIEDLISGTLVYKMLVDRNSRPSLKWWETCCNLAKIIRGVDEPAFLSAFLYYEPETFNLNDFLDIKKDERRKIGVSQDIEIPENIDGGSPIDGLGLCADGASGEEKERCPT